MTSWPEFFATGFAVHGFQQILSVAIVEKMQGIIFDFMLLYRRYKHVALVL